jgi:hypothetical protein
LCIVVALGCILPGRARHFFGSIVGVLLFASAIGYLAFEIARGRLLPEDLGEPSALMAIIFLVVCGLPGLLYAVRTRFGFRADV